MGTLSSTALENISRAVSLAETKTDGEILTVIVKDSYSQSQKDLNLIIMVVFQSLLLWLVLVSLELLSFFSIPSLVIKVLSFLGLVSFLYMLKSILKTREAEDVNQKSMEEFVKTGISHTHYSTGVLLFFSLKEKRMVILADKAVDRKVSADTWKKIVDKTLNKIKDQGLESGILDAVELVGKELEQVCPASSNNPNEISNEVIERE